MGAPSAAAMEQYPSGTGSREAWLEWAATAIGRKVSQNQAVAIVDVAGTGKTRLAKEAVPKHVYYDLSAGDEDWFHGLFFSDRPVIFDEVAAVDPGSIDADMVLQYCEGFQGFIALFQVIDDVPRYLRNGRVIHVFNLDDLTHTQVSVDTVVEK